MKLGIFTRFTLFIKPKKERRDHGMKKYIAPEMMSLSYAAEEAISGELDGSNRFNDGELDW